MENNREYDIIIWGASGFTGRLVAEYLYKNYNAKDLNWAIEGEMNSNLVLLEKNFLIIQFQLF